MAVGLDVWDFVVFACILAISVGIGIFYSCRKQSLSIDFYMAGRAMGPVPVAFSMVATFMSGISLLGNPSEIYVFGTQFMLYVVTLCAFPPVLAHVYLPVLYKLQLTSMFEYVERRFNASLRTVCSLIFIIQMTFYVAVVLYTPALTFNIVLGVDKWILVCVIGIACVFYTTIGGMKAVLWTDVFQCMIMFIGLIIVLVQGSIDQGGFSGIWERMEQNNRVQFFLMDPDPTVRHTFWSVLIGGTFVWITAYSANQAQIQRLLCISTLKKAQIAMWLNIPGLVLIVTVGCMCGMVLNAEYMGCDPLQTGRVSSRDQMLPLYVMDRLSSPGLPGMYVGVITCAGLSSISSGLNSLAAITLFDIIKKLKKDIPTRTEHIINKILVVAYGVLMMVCSYFCYLVPGILQAAISLFGITAGPISGVITLGMLCPFVNSIGAFSGLITSMGLIIWIYIGARTVANPHPHPPPVPPHTTDNCSAPYNASQWMAPTTSEAFVTTLEQTTAVPEVEDEESSWLAIYGLSYMWYSCFCFFVCIIVGILVSLITRCNKGKKINKNLFHPMVGNICGYPDQPEEDMEPGDKKGTTASLDQKPGVYPDDAIVVDQGYVGKGQLDKGHVDNGTTTVAWNEDATKM